MKDKDDDIIDQNWSNLTARQKIIRNSFREPMPHGSFIFPSNRSGKMSEDLTALEKIILDQEKEDLK